MTGAVGNVTDARPGSLFVVLNASKPHAFVVLRNGERMRRSCCDVLMLDSGKVVTFYRDCWYDRYAEFVA